MHYLQKATKQLLRAAKRLEIAEINRSSAEAAYYMIGSTIPLLALSLAIAGRLLPIEKWIAELPLAAVLPASVWDAVRKVADRLIGGSAFPALLSVGALLTLWSAASGMRALCRTTVRLSGGTEISYATAVFRGSIAALLVPPMLGISLLWFYILVKIGGFLLLFPTLLLFCICLTQIFLRQSTPRRLLVVRASFVAGAWELLSLVFRIYLVFVPRTSYIYGGIGAVLLFLLYLRACLWIFLVSFTLLQAPSTPPQALGAFPRLSRKGAIGTWRNKGSSPPWRF